MQKLRTIRLYGKLRAKFGREYKLAVRNPAEAIRALCCLLPGFEAFLMNADKAGMKFAVFAGKDNLSEQDLDMPTGNEVIRIAPILRGSKQGMFQTILGLVLVVVGAVIDYFSAGTGGNQLIIAGATMMAGGIIQMLSPQPQNLSSKDSGANTASYVFNGPVNTQAQGNPVPVLYGRLIVGSAVISAGIQNEDIYAPSSTSLVGSTGLNYKKPGL